MKIGFDLISDLNLSPEDSFDWANKATSLYCLIAGNISSDLRTIAGVLGHLAKHYQGVFYVPGKLEFSEVEHFPQRISEITRICKRIKNVALLHHHVVIIDGIAVLGCTGWYGKEDEYDFETKYKVHRFEDLLYLKNSIEKLQKHLDVKKILVLTSAVPNINLFFGEHPKLFENLPELTMTLVSDSESKIKHWAYGTYEKIVDTTFSNINYVCNPKYERNPYWAKRMEVET